MSLRLKLILGALVAVAGFFVVRVTLLFNHDINIARTEASISSILDPAYSPDDPALKDIDHDGLPDREEIIYGSDPFNPDTDGDSYRDGIEAAELSDPLDPNSNPRAKTYQNLSAISNSANMTDRLLNLGIAGLVDDAGQLNPDQMTTGKFADIMANISAAAELALSGPPLTDQDIRISNDNSVDNIKKYLNTITGIVEEGLFSTTAANMGGSIDNLLGLV